MFQEKPRLDRGGDVDDETGQRWWPATETGRVPHRFAEVVYAAVGPTLTHELVTFYDDAVRHGVRIPGGVALLLEELKQWDGRPPQMLFLMAAAAAANAKLHGYVPGDDIGEAISFLNGGRLDGETAKHFGSHVIESLRAFGLSPRELIRYIEEQYSELPGDEAWPPHDDFTGAPPPVARARFADDSRHDRPDPLAFWLGLFTRPSLIGAHLVGFPDLKRYEAALRAGLENAERDIAGVEWYPDHFDRNQLRADLVGAVERISIAIEMIDDAQETICRIFPT